MATRSQEFTGAGTGNQIFVKAGDSFTYATSGTFDMSWTLQYSTGGGWKNLITGTTVDTATTVKAEVDTFYRMVAHTPGGTPGTLTVVLIELVGADKKLLITNAAGQGKVGTTAGWVVAAGSNIALVTCPASQTASTLVIPITGLVVGESITGLYATGQIESAGGAVTLDVALRKHTAAAADVSDAAVASITQLAAAADTIISATNSRVADLSEVVGANETFYVLVTATTAGSTDIALQSITLEIKP
jgi:hypothetical protein